jgi:hypothetical protein
MEAALRSIGGVSLQSWIEAHTDIAGTEQPRPGQSEWLLYRFALCHQRSRHDPPHNFLHCTFRCTYSRRRHEPLPIPPNTF